jgi:hypothetical protein
VLFLDECIPVQVGRLLATFLKDHPNRPEIKHQTDYYNKKQGVPDEIWVDEIKRNGWLPITSDRGKRNVGQKLPLLMREKGVVYVALSSQVHDLKSPQKAEAIVACWAKIVEVWTMRIGCCHCIQFDNKRTYFRLVQKH